MTLTRNDSLGNNDSLENNETAPPIYKYRWSGCRFTLLT